MKRVSYLTFAFWIIWSIIVGVCAFFIVWNAQWGIGDDAIIMRHTGSGVPFTFRDTTIPAQGRFYPFAYLIYDVLLLFTHGYVSAEAHYWVHLAFFVLMSFSFAILFTKMFEAEKPIWKYVLSLFATFLIVLRLYSDYLNCFSTIWFSYSLMGCFISLVWLYHRYNNRVFAAFSLLIINYLCYCSEIYFVIPLSLGIGGLLFHRSRDREEAWYYYSFLFSGVLYLVLYGIVVLPHIVSAYDGSHGTEVSMVSNAIHQLIGNKILLLAMMLVCFRIIELLKKKSSFTFYDNLIVAAAGYCSACFILRLNWTMYYNIGAILAFPAVVHYCQHYLQRPLILIVLLSFLCLYGYKLPRRIMNSQEARIGTEQQMNILKNAYQDGITLMWYAPEAIYSRAVELREWREVSLCTYIQWLTQNPSFSFDRRVSFSSEDKGIWLIPSESMSTFMGEVGSLSVDKPYFDAMEIVGYMVE